MPDEELKLVEAFLANEEFDRLSDYLGRGRQLKGRSVQELENRWVELMQQWAASNSGFDHHEHQDIEAELRLLKAEPPFDRVGDAMAQLRRRTDEVLERQDLKITVAGFD